MAFFPLCHGYSFCRANLHTYSAPLAIFQIYLDWYGFLDDGVRTVKPAQKAGRLLLFSRDAFIVMYNRRQATPLAGLAGFANSWR
jgi:hypothetical protein